MARKKPFNADLTEQSAALAEFAAKALLAAQQLGIEHEVVDALPFDGSEWDTIADLPKLPPTLKEKLIKGDATFTIRDTTSVVKAVAESLNDGEPLTRLNLLVIAKKLTDSLQDDLVPAVPTKARKSKPAAILYQFKISLLGSKPPIWRRIRIENCTLDKLHEHIQTSMGWTNSHLHHFRIGEQLYGDPMLMEDNMEALDYKDSTRTRISRIVPRTGKPFRFIYEYDFGDGWDHEILFEGSPPKEAGQKYPLCLEGERACPPEDVGGIGGFYEFLVARADPGHEQHNDFIEWGGDFDPERFDAGEATRAMKTGLPDWREEEW